QAAKVEEIKQRKAKGRKAKKKANSPQPVPDSAPEPTKDSGDQPSPAPEAEEPMSVASQPAAPTDLERSAAELTDDEKRSVAMLRDLIGDDLPLLAETLREIAAGGQNLKAIADALSPPVEVREAA